MIKRPALIAMFTVVIAACGNEDNNTCTVSSCDGNTANVCVNGVIVPQVCPIACVNGACAASNKSCAEGQKMCTNGIPMVCSQNQWTAQPACAEGTVCVSGQCMTKELAPECVNSLKRCAMNGMPQICTNNRWQNLTACASNQICRDGNCMATKSECIENAIQCSPSGRPQVCTGGQWINKDACQNGTKCSNGTCLKTTATCSENARQCNEFGIPQVCRANKWVNQNACETGSKCSNGECIKGADTTCNGKTCKTDETCMGAVCVPNSQLNVAQGSACDLNTWVEYCDNNGDAVSCTQLNGVYRAKCGKGNCRVTDLTLPNGGEPWFPAFCDSDKSHLCKDINIYFETPYCYLSPDGKAYESSYQCNPVLGGGFFAIDYDKYFDAQECPYGCDENMEHCATEPKCDKPDYCSGNTLYACSKGKFEQLDCLTELEAVCKSFSSLKYADCFDASDECTTRGDKKNKCSTVGNQGVITEWTCTHADNDGSAKNYWVKTGTSYCPAACNSDRSGCE